MKSRNLVFVGALIGAMTLGSAAMAGMTSAVPVEVLVNADASGQAQGTMSSARFSANTVEFIGCGVRYSITGTTVIRYGWCQATNSAGVYAICNVSNNDLLNAVAALNDYSFIVFAWNAAGACTRIGLSTQSFYIPQ